MNWALNNFGQIAQLTVTHLLLVVPPLATATILAVPVGRLACSVPVIQKTLVRATQLLYAVPSLALVVVIPVVIGVSVTSHLNVMVALGIYAFALLIQNSIDAFAALDRVTLNAARSLGYSRWGLFFRVELPLAAPVFLAGLRVATVSTVALTSIGALVGVTSLGSLLTDGFQRGITAEIVTGIAAIIALALAGDLIILLATCLFLPWTHAEMRRSHAR